MSTNEWTPLVELLEEAPASHVIVCDGWVLTKIGGFIEPKVSSFKEWRAVAPSISAKVALEVAPPGAAQCLTMLDFLRLREKEASLIGTLHLGEFPVVDVYKGMLIYQCPIRGEGIRLAVETFENRDRRLSNERPIGGDTLHKTIDAARAAVEAELRREREVLEASRLHDEEVAASGRKTEENRGLTIAERKANAHLDKLSTIPITRFIPSHASVPVTNRQIIEAAVVNGFRVEAVHEYDEAARSKDERILADARKHGVLIGYTNPNLPKAKTAIAAQERLDANEYSKTAYRLYSDKTDGDRFFDITKTMFEYAESIKSMGYLGFLAKTPFGVMTVLVKTEPGMTIDESRRDAVTALHSEFGPIARIAVRAEEAVHFDDLPHGVWESKSAKGWGFIGKGCPEVLKSADERPRGHSLGSGEDGLDEPGSSSCRHVFSLNP